MMTAPLLLILSYYALGLTGISISFLYMCDAFGWPHERYKTVMYLLFFMVRFTYDINAYYDTIVVQEAPSFSVKAATVILSYLWAVMSFGIVVWVFGGQKLQSLTVAFLVNIISGSITAIGSVLGNVLTGASLDGSFFKPFDLSIAIAVAASWLLYPLFRWPTALLSRWVRGISQRYHTFLCAVLVILNLTYVGFAVTSFLFLPVYTLFVFLFLTGVVTILPFVVVQQWSTREAAVRERMLLECSKLIASYDGLARERLSQLERDHLLFERNNEVLARLQQGALDSSLRQRIGQLEETYQRISCGTYCEQPPLDAVLVSYAARLRELGVEPQFSVSGGGSNGVSQALVSLALLNLATSTARRTKHPEGFVVAFRIRSVSGGTLYHLEMPAAWGRLGARQFLKGILPAGISAVRERVEREATTVLAFGEDELS